MSYASKKVLGQASLWDKWELLAATIFNIYYDELGGIANFKPSLVNVNKIEL